MAKAAYTSICGEHREACRCWRHLLCVWVCHPEWWLCPCVPLAAPSQSRDGSQGFLFGLTYLHPVFQELLRRCLPLAQPLHPLSNAWLCPLSSAHTRDVSQGQDCVTTFLPSRGCRVPWGTCGRGPGKPGLGVRRDFPTVLQWDKRRLCGSLRPDAGGTLSLSVLMKNTASLVRRALGRDVPL